jgi:Domain of unknown function (DUF4351)
MESVSADYDGAWKLAVQELFPAFLAALFPVAHANIDWTQAVTFRDTEVQQSDPERTTGKQRVDVLAQVVSTDGTPAEVLVHVEIQSQRDTSLPERMFRYYGRIFDRDQVPVVSLVVLADDSPTFHPDSFRYARWGCEIVLRFPTIKLLDLDRAMLEADPSIFAAIILMHRDAQETTGQPAARMARKFARWRQVLRGGYDAVTVRVLLDIMDRLMRLPVALREPTTVTMQQIEREETNMERFITSFEEVGFERGLEAGRQEERRSLVLHQLETACGPLSVTTRDRIAQLSADHLQALAFALLRFTQQADLERWLDQATEAPMRDPAVP